MPPLYKLPYKRQSRNKQASGLNKSVIDILSNKAVDYNDISNIDHNNKLGIVNSRLGYDQPNNNRYQYKF